jgi:hypothetical protein
MRDLTGFTGTLPFAAKDENPKPSPTAAQVLGRKPEAADLGYLLAHGVDVPGASPMPTVNLSREERWRRRRAQKFAEMQANYDALLNPKR